MKHNIRISGYSYRLRPVELADAQFIVDTRLEDEKKSQYVHKISPDVNLQINWLNNYFEREGDYYFIVENLFTKEKEGLISIYDVNGDIAEWGRWVFKRGSLGALESVNLIYKVAFEKLGLNELYTRTVEDNTTVVNFHKSINAKYRTLLKDEFELEGKKYNAVEQYVDKEYYFSTLENFLDIRCQKLFERNMKNAVGSFKFHHYGIACKNIDIQCNEYKNYKKSDYFEDEFQGVKGLFMVSDYKLPTLELLENLDNSNTVTPYLTENSKIYHSGYLVENIEKAHTFLVEILGAKIISDFKQSVYFKKRICFLILKNKKMIELIEEKSNDQ